MERKRVLGLAVLHDPSALGMKVTLDLVLIHGLNGDYLSTWTYQGGGPNDGRPQTVCWPKDLLPTVLPTVRVLSFDYNADIYGNMSVSEIRDHARSLLGRLKYREAPANRPIVFAAHSLGGIVLKQALCTAHIESKYRHLLSATRGIIFFGTPHFGGDRDRFLAIAKSFAPLFPSRFGWRGRYHPMVDSLTRNSSDISNVCEDFQCLAARFPIASFYETGVWPGTRTTIVDKLSARMHLHYEEAVPVEKNHLDICRFRDIDEPGFRYTCDFIVRMATGRWRRH